MTNQPVRSDRAGCADFLYGRGAGLHAGSDDDGFASASHGDPAWNGGVRADRDGGALSDLQRAFAP